MNGTPFASSSCSTQANFFDDAGRTSHHPSDLVGEEPRPSPEAVFSILQFGACVPPWSPWQGVYRFMPGYRYRGTTIVGPIELPEMEALSTTDLDRSADQVERLMDSILTDQLGDRTPAVLFSGGIDSGFIACRLAALGRTDTILLNFSFSGRDEEAELASQMAQRLGLTYVRVSPSVEDVACLEEPGVRYPQPFADRSTGPAFALADGVYRLRGNDDWQLIDGTGADGAFGMGAKVRRWPHVYRLPRTVRQLASTAYQRRLWQRPGRLEAATKILARSAQLPLLSASLAQNALSGRHYSSETQHVVNEALRGWTVGWSGGDQNQNLVAADLALTCANVFAQKTRPLLEREGHSVLFPFLDDAFVSMALGSLSDAPTGFAKAPLKASLARHLPKDMVHRPKSGFVDPKAEVFYDELFLAHLSHAFSDSAVVAPFINRNALALAHQSLGRGLPLPPQVLNFVWAVVFLDRWYRTSVR
jgi:asparagine synthetase B (glutamine-hydrolysing)